MIASKRTRPDSRPSPTQLEWASRLGMCPLWMLLSIAASACAQDAQFGLGNETSSANDEERLSESGEQHSVGNEGLEGFDWVDTESPIRPVNVAGANLVDFECRTFHDESEGRRIACLSAWSSDPMQPESGAGGLDGLRIAVLTVTGEAIDGIGFESVSARDESRASFEQDPRILHYSAALSEDQFAAAGRVNVLRGNADDASVVQSEALLPLSRYSFDMDPGWDAEKLVRRILRQRSEAHPVISSEVFFHSNVQPAPPVDELAEVSVEREEETERVPELCSGNVLFSGLERVQVPRLSDSCNSSDADESSSLMGANRITAAELTTLEVKAPRGAVLCGLDVQFRATEFSYDAAIEFRAAGQFIARSFSAEEDNWQSLANSVLPQFQRTCASSTTDCELNPGSATKELNVRANLDLSQVEQASRSFEVSVGTYAVSSRFCSRSGFEIVYEYTYVEVADD
jgi:hypothetical protein